MAFKIHLIALMLLVPAGTRAQEGHPDALKASGSGAGPASRARGGESTGLVSVDHHMTLRLRPELLLDGDLGSGASPILPALEGDDSLLSWASIRLRYDATVHLGQRFEIHLSVDALDNLVLGSTPLAGSGHFEDGLAVDGQASPTTGLNSVKDALRVRSAFGSWHFLDALDVDFGRMTDHFGLGLIRNRGDCVDCDRGSVVDGVRFGLDIYGLRAEATIEFTDVGALDSRLSRDGQARDLGIDDDTSTYTWRLQSERMASRSPRERAKEAPENLSVNWGLFFSFTDQLLSAGAPADLSLSTDCHGVTSPSGDLLSLPYDCWQLTPRELFLWQPSLWARVDWRPDFQSRLVAEVELSGLFGSVKELQGDPELGDTSKDFSGFAGALEFRYESGSLETGLDTGFATGDDRRFLGYLDGQNIIDPDDANYEANENVRTNTTVTSFWFHQDYRLDLLLFRQIIGGVTNAYYVKPWVAYRLLDNESTTLKARFDVGYAGAMKSSGTPGGGSHWGVEMDAGLQLGLEDGLEISVNAGLLVPMDALRDPTTGADPTVAFGLRGLLVWHF